MEGRLLVYAPDRILRPDSVRNHPSHLRVHSGEERLESNGSEAPAAIVNCFHGVGDEIWPPFDFPKWER